MQTELQAKHGSPNFGPTHIPAMIQPPPIPRTLLNRHHNRRSTSSIAPKVEPGYSTLPPIHAGNLPGASPKLRPTPSSHTTSAASPTTTDGFGVSPSSENAPGSMRPGMPPTGMKQPGNPMGQMPGPPRMMPPMQTGLGHQAGHVPHATRMNNASGAPFYEAPGYRSHLEQLGEYLMTSSEEISYKPRKLKADDLTEQEYDAAADMMEDGAVAEDAASGPGPYPGSAYASHAAQHQVSPTTTGPMETNAVTGQPQHQQQQGMSMTQLLDPSMDWDPFGLSASMAFPSSFSFDTSNMR